MNGVQPDNASPGDGAVGLTSTADYIAFHAGQRPSAVAVIDAGNEVTYAEFHDDLRRVTSALRDFELAPGSSVAIEWTSLYSHWLLVLAFEKLGVATTAYTRENREVQAFFDLMDLVMCTEDAVPDGDIRTHLLTREWFRTVLALDPEDDAGLPVIDPDAPNHIAKSSGTTGTGRLMIRTNKAHEFLINQHIRHSGFTEQSRYFISLGFAVQSVFSYATTCIRRGGTCIWDSKTSLAEALAHYRATHVTLLPIALLELLDDLPDDYEKASGLTVITIGAPVPEAVRRRALSTFASDLVESYSTNETGRVCTMNAEGVGTVWSGVDVEVVDDDDRPVDGKEGRVRIKSDGCASGYLDDPDATRRMFRDGWFRAYPVVTHTHYM